MQDPTENPASEILAPSETPLSEPESSNPEPATASRKRQTKEERLHAMLDPATRFRLMHPGRAKLASSTDEHSESQRLYHGLSPAAKEKLAVSDDEIQDWTAGRKPQHFTIECADGEHPLTRIFRNEEAQLSRARDLEGKDVNVILVYGIIKPISKAIPGEARIVFLPNNTARRLDSKLTLINELETTVEIQEDGFLGPPELIVVSQRVEPDTKPNKSRRKPSVAAPDDDEFDDVADD